VKVGEDDGVVSAVLSQELCLGGGKCPRRYTWVDGCKAVEFDDVRE